MKDVDAEKQRIERLKRNTRLMESRDGTETGLIIVKMNPKSWRAVKAEWSGYRKLNLGAVG